ncbi:MULTISPECIES: GAF and ANTAR domain-containing protein [unclassified Kribbella]|uniref:GAF and ANTAR domain-containing protein n=1 Tax=unclassified Kribbella TaxID=2644121 RepID=UPI0033FFCBE6
MPHSEVPNGFAAAADGGSGGGASADAFGRLAMELHDVDGVEETVEAVVQFALHALGCTYAGVVLVARGRRPEVLALTDPLVATLYELQIEAGDGPMITAIQEERVVLVADVEAETRWSRAWITQVRAAEIRTIVHLPLLAHGRAEAVLSLYDKAPNAFDDDDLAIAHILARHASVAIANAREEESLAEAIDARKLIGQAMGILMERYGLDGDRAFEVLKRYSQQYNRKLRDVAQELIDTRRLPH